MGTQSTTEQHEQVCGTCDNCLAGTHCEFICYPVEPLASDEASEDVCDV